MNHIRLVFLKKFQKSIINGHGFTIVELIIGIAIATVLLAIAVPSFEALVYGSSANRATLELISDLQDARMKAIRTNQQVTVAFNQPAQDQYTVTWNNGNRTKLARLRSQRISFDNNPPGGAPNPDDSFMFNNLGFIQPSLGNPTGNIYLVDNVNGRRFRIATTVAGGIIEQQWDGTAWPGPELSVNP